MFFSKRFTNVCNFEKAIYLVQNIVCQCYEEFVLLEFFVGSQMQLIKVNRVVMLVFLKINVWFDNIVVSFRVKT